jgi:hypothetical protein
MSVLKVLYNNYSEFYNNIVNTLKISKTDLKTYLKNLNKEQQTTILNNLGYVFIYNENIIKQQIKPILYI